MKDCDLHKGGGRACKGEQGGDKGISRGARRGCVCVCVCVCVAGHSWKFRKSGRAPNTNLNNEKLLGSSSLLLLLLPIKRKAGSMFLIQLKKPSESPCQLWQLVFSGAGVQVWQSQGSRRTERNHVSSPVQMHHVS